MKTRIIAIIWTLTLMLTGKGVAQDIGYQLINADKSSVKVTDGGQYMLINPANEPMKYSVRDCGINIAWGKSSDVFSTATTITIVREPGKSGPLKSGEKFAIKVNGAPAKEPYVKYGSRDNGINLVWSSTPSYEWRFVTTQVPHETPPLTELSTNMKFGLYNTVKESKMVYCPHRRGCHLLDGVWGVAWAGDCVKGYYKGGL